MGGQQLTSVKNKTPNQCGGAVGLDESGSFQQECSWLLPQCSNIQSSTARNLFTQHLDRFLFQEWKKFLCPRFCVSSQKHQYFCFTKGWIKKMLQCKPGRASSIAADMHSAGESNAFSFSISSQSPVQSILKRYCFLKVLIRILNSIAVHLII